VDSGVSVNMGDLPDSLLRAASALADSLLAEGPLAAYAEAELRLSEDAGALELLDSVRNAQAQLRLKQTSGQVVPADIRYLRELQRSMQAQGTIAAYIGAQSEAKDYLRLVNSELSDLLGLDFASFLSSSCC
jgi:cell fate (sporulation/competence/biofilm development) regulator YlbF (YheA/YmcA/DUF963 family)